MKLFKLYNPEYTMIIRADNFDRALEMFEERIGMRSKYSITVERISEQGKEELLTVEYYGRWM